MWIVFESYLLFVSFCFVLFSMIKLSYLNVMSSTLQFISTYE